MANLFYNFISRTVSKAKGRKYELDRTIPIGVLFTVVLRRAVWLARGIVKTTILQGRPRMVFMGPGVKLRNARMIHFGKGVTLETGVIIDGLSRNGVVLGDNVSIGAYSVIRSTGVLTNLGVGVQLGNDSAIDAYSFIGAAGGVQIGNQVIMGQHVSFHAENHHYDSVDVPIKEQGTSRQGIDVENNCWVGSNVTFLDGARLRNGCVIGAGSVVKGNVPEFSVAVGVPARVVKVRTRLGLNPNGDARVPSANSHKGREESGSGRDILRR